MLKDRQAPLGTLIAYKGVNPSDYEYISPIIEKIRNSEFDSWNEKEQLSILKLLSIKEIENLVQMCNQILNEKWDEFSIITGYSLNELSNLKLFLQNIVDIGVMDIGVMDIGVRI